MVDFIGMYVYYFRPKIIRPILISILIQSYTSQVLSTFEKSAHQSHLGRQKMGWFLED